MRRAVDLFEGVILALLVGALVLAVIPSLALAEYSSTYCSNTLCDDTLTGEEVWNDLEMFNARIDVVADNWRTYYTTRNPWPSEWKEWSGDAWAADRTELSLIIGHSTYEWVCEDPECQVIRKKYYIGFGTHGRLWADEVRLGYQSGTYGRNGNYWAYIVQCSILNSWDYKEYAKALKGSRAFMGSVSTLYYYIGDLDDLGYRITDNNGNPMSLKYAFAYTFINDYSWSPSHKYNRLRMIFESSSYADDTIYDYDPTPPTSNSWKYVEEWWWESTCGCRYHSTYWISV